MIVFDKVAKRYPNGREALAGATLRVDPGEMVFLTGKSGAGKSTVLKLIALLERPTRGTVLINNRNTSTMRSGWASAQVAMARSCLPRSTASVAGEVLAKPRARCRVPQPKRTMKRENGTTSRLPLSIVPWWP